MKKHPKNPLFSAFLPFLTGISLAVTLAPARARADGFVCGTDDRELMVRVYHSTDPSEGTRSADVMILSDPTAEPGHQTIARFDQADGDLQNGGSLYVAQLNPEMIASDLGDSYVSATRLSAIRAITLDIQFSYADPVPAGSIVPGTLTWSTWDSDTQQSGQVQKAVTCERYLKH